MSSYHDGRVSVDFSVRSDLHTASMVLLLTWGFPFRSSRPKPDINGPFKGSFDRLEILLRSWPRGTWAVSLETSQRRTLKMSVRDFDALRVFTRYVDLMRPKYEIDINCHMISRTSLDELKVTLGLEEPPAADDVASKSE